MRRLVAPVAASAFSIVELLVVVAIIAVLLAIVVPAVSGAKFLAYRADCLANLRHIGTATHTYAAENNHQLPTLYRTASPFTTYFMRTESSGDVNLGILAAENYAPRPHAFYCTSQERMDNASLTHDGPDNAWDGPKFRSSYPARLIEVDGAPMPSGTKTDWNTIQYGQSRVVFSDFLGVDGFQGGGIIVGTLWAPHRGRGYNRLFGEGSARWCEPGPLTSQVDATAPTPEEHVAYYEELDELP